MYYVYILKSLTDCRYYTGYTKDLERRLKDHNRGKSKAIKYRGPFEVVYKEEHITRIEAIHREIAIKRYKGGNEFKKLLNSPL